MTEILIRKFKQHPDLQDLLLGTNDADIIYGDETDGFWGDGADKKGQNELGKVLVRVREYLRNEIDSGDHGEG